MSIGLTSIRRNLAKIKIILISTFLERGREAIIVRTPEPITHHPLSARSIALSSSAIARLVPLKPRARLRQ